MPLPPVSRLRRLALRRIVLGFAATLLAVVFSATLASGERIKAMTVGRSFAATSPRMTVEPMPARAANGTLLGTMLLPAIVGQAGTRDDNRPLIVVFNGGPGAATGWLLLGLLGPYRAVVPEAPLPPGAGPLALVPNREGLWDRADMLFVDPLGTGFSRARPGVDPHRIRDWRKDGGYIALAVREWMERHGRTGAPVFLVGESYGAERAVAVANLLTRGIRPVRLAGMVLISQTVVDDDGLAASDRKLASATALPTMAATACYHGKAMDTPAAPADCAARAQEFAENSYLPALRQGARLPASRRHAVEAALARMTGLDEARLVNAGLEVNRQDYRRLALGPSSLVLGMYDTRFRAPGPMRKGWQDPSLDPLIPAMQFSAELQNRILLKLDRSPLDGSRYVMFNADLHATWRYDGKRTPYGSIDLARSLAGSLKRSGARLLIAGGMFDTVGSYGNDRYLASRLGLPPARVAVRSYPGGHMFYLSDASRLSFIRELRSFISVAGHAAPDGTGSRNVIVTGQ